jgi:hypothetical protein
LENRFYSSMSSKNLADIRKLRVDPFDAITNVMISTVGARPKVPCRLPMRTWGSSIIDLPRAAIAKYRYSAPGLELPNPTGPFCGLVFNRISKKVGPKPMEDTFKMRPSGGHTRLGGKLGVHSRVPVNGEGGAPLITSAPKPVVKPTTAPAQSGKGWFMQTGACDCASEV